MLTVISDLTLYRVSSMLTVISDLTLYRVSSMLTVISDRSMLTVIIDRTISFHSHKAFNDKLHDHWL